MLNKFLKMKKNEVPSDFFLNDYGFNYIFEELKIRNFLIKMSQSETDRINMFVCW